MPRPPFLANVVSAMFIVAALVIVALRSTDDLWVPLTAAAIVGAVAAEAIGLVLGRRQSA